MKRFAFIYNQHPMMFIKIPWFVENFDQIVASPVVDTLNDYDVLWCYTISGANSKKMNEYIKWNMYPKYLRENGITKPKILYQEDYYYTSQSITSGRDTYFSAKHILPYVDGVVHVGYRNWSHLPRPAFYVQTPLEYPIAKWTDFDDKINAAVSINRSYGRNDKSEFMANLLGIKWNELGKSVPRKYKHEYFDYISSHKIALDYNDIYFGWSRFVAESAYAGTPVIGPPHRMGCRVANPELCGDITQKMVLNGRKLLNNKDYYEEARTKALNNIKEHLSVESCEKRIRNMLSKFCDDL